MSSNGGDIFGTYARLHWEVGLPVIPIKVGQKLPAVAAWSEYCDRMPTEEEMDKWLLQYSDCNIGLALGPCAGLVAIDIDCEEHEDKVLSVLPKSPWIRIGKKGSARIYRARNFRTFRIKDGTNKMLVEYLGRGTQLVLPPSIHPETKRPYTSNTNLWEVLDRIPMLDDDIEDVLRNLFVRHGVNLSSSGWTKVTEFVPQGARDTSMVAHAGLLARAVVRGERTLAEALREIEHWIETYCENVIGDPLDPEKGRERLLNFLIKDVKKGGRTLPRGWDHGLDDQIRKLLEEKLDKEDEQWTYTIIEKYIKDAFNTYPPGSSQRNLSIETALDKIAESKHVGAIEEAQLISLIMKMSAGTIDRHTLRSALWQRRKGSIEGKNHNEIADCVIEDICSYGEVKYWLEKFWQWRGAYWEEIHVSEIEKVVSADYGHYPAARRNSDYKGIIKTIESKLRGKLKTLPDEGINFANGFLTRKFELLPHNAGFGATYVLPYRYMKELSGECPKFFEFLETIWGADEDYLDKVEALREAIAVTMWGLGPRFNRAICLYGVARSGKSQLLNIVSGLFNKDAMSNVSPVDWSDKFIPSQMAGKLLNVCGELEENRLINGAKFKEIVGGERQIGQEKNKPLFVYYPIATHWFAGNHLPKTKDSSDGFSRRWLFLEFTRPVPEEKKMLDIGNVICSEEREAIVAWAIESLPIIEARKDLLLPPSHKRIERLVSIMTNPVRLFLSEACEMKDSESILLDELFGHFQVFFSSTTRFFARKVDFNEFCEMLRMTGVKTDSKKAYGVAVREEPVT